MPATNARLSQLQGDRTINPDNQIQRLLDIMAQLRDPESGCPWDLEQDFSTIAPYTIEEAYEVADAIQHGDLHELRDELGDLLFQVVFYARMGEEAGLELAYFDIADGRRTMPEVLDALDQLDLACAGGQLAWVGRGALGARDGRIVLLRPSSPKSRA